MPYTPGPMLCLGMGLSLAGAAAWAATTMLRNSDVITRVQHGMTAREVDRMVAEYRLGLGLGVFAG